MLKNKPIVISGQTIEPGTFTSVTLPSTNLYTQTKIDIPVHVFHGKIAGPKVFVISTIHGDELNSIEIIRRLHRQRILKKIHGTLITIPVANVLGLVSRMRYLPDRRDLNRSFPGNKTGSLAARLANIFTEEILTHCNYGIDLHTGAIGRNNMPQLRVNLDTPGAEKLAVAFGVPVILNAKIRDGSLRGAASELGIPLLVYEGGEALRYNEICIRAGVRGVLNVLNKLHMINLPPNHRMRKHKPVITQTTRWVRAENSGIIQPLAQLSEPVKKGQKLAYIHDPFLQNKSTSVIAPFDGIIIGQLNSLLVSEGDAIYNIASIKKLKDVNEYIEDLQDELINNG